MLTTWRYIRGAIDVSFAAAKKIFIFVLLLQDKEKSGSKEAIVENGVSDSEDAKTPEGDKSVSEELISEDKSIEKSTESIDEKASDENTTEGKKGKKDKLKKKWSFKNTIASTFSRKDKAKPTKDADKNGDVKEPLPEEVSNT